MRDYSLGRGSNLSMVTFSDAANLWMRNKKNKVKESTFAVYHHAVVRHLIPDLGKMKLSSISEDTLNQYLDDLMNSHRLRGEGALSWKTVSDIRSILRMILDCASRNGYPQLAAVQLTLRSPKPSTMQVFTREEQRRLVTYLLENLTPLNLGILLSLFSGLRIGEICGIRWGDIDFTYGTLRVNRTVIRISDLNGETGRRTKVVVTDPKTVHSIRTIPVPGDVLSLLEKFRREEDYYLLTGTGKCMEPRTMLSNYKSVLKAAGLPDYRYHTLRHTFASRCVEQDFDMKSLSEIMGHANVKITMDRYVHPSMEYKKQQMDRLTLPITTGN